MTDRDLIWTRILVGIDQSTTARRALHTAIDVTHSLGGELIIVSAYQPIGAGELNEQRLHAPPDVAYRLQPDAGVREILDDAQRQATARGVRSTCVAQPGSAAEVILGVADERQAALIIVGNRGMHGRRLFRTSIPNEVSHRARCSVLIVDTMSAVAA